MPAATLNPRSGFDWRRVRWGGPTETRTESCSYCPNVIPEESVPLMLFKDDGSLAQFCDDCQRTWWGVEAFPPEGA